MNIATSHRPESIRSQQGFSMLEILITLVIIATALLGTAALQIHAMRIGQSSQFRSLAIFLASDLAERMEANKAAAVAGSYVVAATNTPPTTSTACTTGPCNSAALATYDLSQWQNSVASLLPQSSWAVAQTTTGNPSTYTITVSWIDRRSDTTYATTGTGETFSYTSTRTIFNLP